MHVYWVSVWQLKFSNLLFVLLYTIYVHKSSYMWRCLQVRSWWCRFGMPSWLTSPSAKFQSNFLYSLNSSTHFPGIWQNDILFVNFRLLIYTYYSLSKKNLYVLFLFLLWQKRNDVNMKQFQFIEICKI